MELMIKASAIAVSVAITALILRKQTPELAIALSLCTLCLILLSAIGMLGSFRKLLDSAQRMLQHCEPYIAAILKCLAISVLTRLSADLCRDANQTALSSGVELAGTICALCVILPLLTSALGLLEELV